MADTKISALTVATTPLAGTEVLPIVQGGVTKQVSVADLTAGRAVSALSLTLTNALTAANGGTGQSSYAVGDLLYASTTTALSKLADVATGNALISGGVGVAPSWGKIGLTTHVSGTLGVGNGGTGTATAFTAGSVVFAGASGVYSQNNSQFFWDNTNVRLGIGIGSPVWALDVRAAAGIGINFLENTSGNTNRVQLGADGAGLGYIDVNAGAGSIALGLFVGGSKKFTVDSNGNLIPAGASKGINFTANSAAAGMTSQLLNWYEQGTFTPTYYGSTTTGTTTYTLQSGTYTRIGNVLYYNIRIAWSGATGTGNGTIGGFPYSAQNAYHTAAVLPSDYALTASNIMSARIGFGNTMDLFQTPVGGGTQTAVGMDTAAELTITGHYFI